MKSSDTSPLVAAIEAGARQVSDIATVKAGLMAYEVGNGTPAQTKEMKDGRVYHSRQKIDESYSTYLDGKDVSRFHLGWSGEYLKYGKNLAAPRTIDLFNKPRILVRQIPSKPPYCIHARFVDGLILNDRNSMNVIALKCDPFFVLGVLNSKAISYWFIHKFGKLQRGIFPQFKINELKIFPIPTVDDGMITKISSISQTITELIAKEDLSPSELARVKELNGALDALVYESFTCIPQVACRLR